MWFCLCHTENVFVSLWQKFWHLLFLRSPFVLAFEGFEGSHSSCQWIVALSGSSSCFSSSCNNACTILDTYTAGTANTVNLCITILVQVLTQAERQIISWPARLCYYRRLTNNCTGLTTRYSKTISVFLAFIFLYYDCTMRLLPKLCLCVINVSMKLAYTMNVI